jgi:hypothetical protein
MEKGKLKIVVRDRQSSQVLYECSLGQAEKAYNYAAEMEKLGLDVEVISPTLSETLSSSLGLSQQQLQEYKQSVEDEMESHDGSCCFEEDNSKKSVH